MQQQVRPASLARAGMVRLRNGHPRSCSGLARFLSSYTSVGSSVVQAAAAASTQRDCESMPSRILKRSRSPADAQEDVKPVVIDVDASDDESKPSLEAARERIKHRLALQLERELAQLDAEYERKGPTGPTIRATPTSAIAQTVSSMRAMKRKASASPAEIEGTTQRSDIDPSLLGERSLPRRVMSRLSPDGGSKTDRKPRSTAPTPVVTSRRSQDVWSSDSEMPEPQAVSPRWGSATDPLNVSSDSEGQSEEDSDEEGGSPLEIDRRQRAVSQEIRIGFETFLVQFCGERFLDIDKGTVMRITGNHLKVGRERVLLHRETIMQVCGGGNCQTFNKLKDEHRARRDYAPHFIAANGSYNPSLPRRAGSHGFMFFPGRPSPHLSQGGLPFPLFVKLPNNEGWLYAGTYTVCRHNDEVVQGKVSKKWFREAHLESERRYRANDGSAHADIAGAWASGMTKHSWADWALRQTPDRDDLPSGSSDDEDYLRPLWTGHSKKPSAERLKQVLLDPKDPRLVLHFVLFKCVDYDNALAEALEKATKRRNVQAAPPEAKSKTIGPSRNTRAAAAKQKKKKAQLARVVPQPRQTSSRVLRSHKKAKRE